ncbi:MAG: hypothetical protein JOZ08_13575 [Verrucomicrobia bacterium]|nr:hypothetical protein [Verrucomicrobiota bacterium]MBV8278559.1 hypothetical protein [Verrucomicrobiota bacterium]
MIETTGTVTEVCKFSKLEDQITIEVVIPSSTEEKETHSVDWAVPAGTVKVGATVRIIFIQ